MIHDTHKDRWIEACDKIDELNDTIVSLRAELAQFRAVMITAVDEGDWEVEIDTNEWAAIPLKVYVKDDHA